jgi:hypothetical protein
LGDGKPAGTGTCCSGEEGRCMAIVRAGFSAKKKVKTIIFFTGSLNFNKKFSLSMKRIVFF